MSSSLKSASASTSKEGNAEKQPGKSNKPQPQQYTAATHTANPPTFVHSHVPTINNSSTAFSAPITPREEQLQTLLSQERQRSEQRRNNYNTLKEEHLRLQNEYLGLQAEMKHVLEETVYFKDKKNAELEQLLVTIEEKSKSVDKLERTLRENEPEVIRLKCAAEMEEPLKRLQKENDRLAKEKEKSQYETQLVKQQLEHLEKEHIDSIERVRLSYEAEVNLVKREKEEIRNRLVEASQSPDVKRIVEMSEENSRLNRKLQSAQVAIEQAEAQYRQIQSRIEQFVLDQDQREKLYENDVKQLQDQMQTQKQEMKSLRKQMETKKNENDELLEEISRLKRIEEKLRFEMEQYRIRAHQEKEDLRREFEKEKTNLVQDNLGLSRQITKMKSEMAARDASVDAMHRELDLKSKEITEKVIEARKQDLDKVCLLEQKKKSLENSIKEMLNERQTFKSEISKLRKQSEQNGESKLSFEREIMILRAKVESQSETIEELDKIRRQHIALHEEVNRLRSDTFDMMAANKELSRSAQNAKEELARAREQHDEDRRNLEELKIAHEKAITKLSRRYEDERTELREKVALLERESTRLRAGVEIGQEMKQGLNEYNRLRAKQYVKIAERLNAFVEQLKVEDNANAQADNRRPGMDSIEANIPSTPNRTMGTPGAHNHLQWNEQRPNRRQTHLESQSAASTAECARRKVNTRAQ